MRKTKEIQGITLIALVITIIVLLILAGIAISQLTNSNIFNNAQVAVDEYNTKAGQTEVVIGQLKELLIQYSEGSTPVPTPTPTSSQGHTITYNANGGTGSMDEEIATIAGINRFTPPTGKVFLEWNTAANGSGTSYVPGAAIHSDVTLYAIWGYTAESVLAIGTEVSVNGEQFYVLEASDATQSTVTLIAKYNLAPTANPTTGEYYQLPNVDFPDTAFRFATTDYFANDYVQGMDLNTYTTPEVASAKNQTAENNAIMRARAYATNTIDSNATGRLLTSAEANALKTDYATMIYGKGNQRGTDSSNYGLLYWLSDGITSTFWEGDYDIAAVSGSVDAVATADWWDASCTDTVNNRCFWGFSQDHSYGVRPVVTVSKTLLR